MLKDYNVKSCIFIFLLTIVLVFPVSAIAQIKNNKIVSKEKNNKVSPLNKKTGQKTIKPKKKLSITAALSKKIVSLEAELSGTKTALLQSKKAGAEKDKYIVTLNADIKGVESLLSQKNTELAMQSDEIKNLQDLRVEKDAEFVTLKSKHVKHNNVISCYRTALSEWDDTLRKRELTRQDHLTISRELRSTISKCPGL